MLGDWMFIAVIFLYSYSFNSFLTLSSLWQTFESFVKGSTLKALWAVRAVLQILQIKFSTIFLLPLFTQLFSVTIGQEYLMPKSRTYTLRWPETTRKWRSFAIDRTNDRFTCCNTYISTCYKEYTLIFAIL